MVKNHGGGVENMELTGITCTGRKLSSVPSYSLHRLADQCYCGLIEQIDEDRIQRRGEGAWDAGFQTSRGQLVRMRWGYAEADISKCSSFNQDWRLEHVCLASFAPESLSHTLFWVKDRNLSYAAQINISWG